MKALFVYVTCATTGEAQKIARVVVEDRLAACANILAPHRALYWWDGAVQEGAEVAIVFKTNAVLFEALAEKIRGLHSYDCPCIVALPIEAGYAPFLQWIDQQTGAGS